ncbi:eukaryotic translation initiation factor 5-like [Strongylocentrotus purpuratus]|uniref:Eukaryotic translation initiation factor 5 n=1 Tax=Strongylocentrotus purpuratus TaxID=7668 RepID=A0A7M7HN55_STRPU|nr:eukaryotic translation initiation factor 5 [Strongylocentrotus purpuratus]XP_030854841.1 eukaryotic translation initiation factor 5-like [Strongylocentrotus purpuratus]|eukprot:XP_011674971.1 PREDICTED: eukaryotic translation initiation factor 5 [Strongylocentrotus purpuratus]
MSLNVNRAVTDQFYRYKMPRLLAKVEGSGNGIKTVIINMVEIGKSLCRPPTYPTKFFGCELGAQTQFDFKNNRFIVNGSHDANKLQDLLDIFIKKYVLCPECDNPETFLIVKKGNIGQRCIACGHVGIVDLRHKLSTFIIKNPPEHDPRSVGSSKTERKGKKSQNKQQNGEGDACQEEEDFGDDDDEEWSVDTSEEAIRERMGDLSGGAKGLTLNDDLEKTGQERLDIFYKFVKAKKAGGDLKGCDKEFLVEAERLDVKDKGPLILAELLLDEQVLTQLKQHQYHFLRLLNDNPKGQKYFLNGLEQLIALHAKSLVPKVPSILKAVYDLDLIDEDVILTWAAKPSKKYVSKEVMQQIHEKAAPFIKWLKEAEEEESSEDEVVVAFSNRGGAGLKVETTEPKKASAAQPATPAAKEDDFDIDDI